jgi:CPA2 family monovalent cation:H+ antiporter-2
MHEAASDLTGLAIIALAALACGMAMQRLRQPPVLGYILAGAILGPAGLGVTENREFIQLLAELGVLMLLFLIGMELSLRSVREVWRLAVAVTVAQIAVGMMAMAAFGLVLDWPLPLTLLLGFVVAISSTAVAIKMLEELGELRSRTGQITIAILVVQDLAVVPMMLIVSAFGGADGGGGAVEVTIKVVLSVSFLALLVFYLLRRERLHLPFARVVGRNQDLIPLAGLAFCFGAAAVSGLLGLSAAYGAFLAGLVIGNSTSRRVMIHHTGPIQAVLLMVFFLSIGLLLDFAYIWNNLGIVISIVFFVAVLKTALNVVFIRVMGQPWPRAFLSGALLAQLGEFSFVLAALGLSAGAIDDASHRLIVAVTVLSLLVSPFWLGTARRLHGVMLLGITSGRETLRLTFGPEALVLARSSARAESAATQAARGAARWLGARLRRRKPKQPEGET